MRPKSKKVPLGAEMAIILHYTSDIRLTFDFLQQTIYLLWLYTAAKMEINFPFVSTGDAAHGRPIAITKGQPLCLFVMGSCVGLLNICELGWELGVLHSENFAKGIQLCDVYV